MDSEQLVEVIESSTLFGDLYEWNKCSIPRYQITSLLISDDSNFSQIDLSVICQISPLRQLFLHNLNRLETVPPAIARLNQLKVLSITHCNSLLKLPLAMRFLFNLETLRLDCANLRELPAFLCLVPSLNLLLLRKAIAICSQCKQHPRKSTRIIILPQPQSNMTDTSNSTHQKNVVSLSVLAANSYISYFSTHSFYQSIPFRTLWSTLEAALNLEMNRCIICLSNCSENQKISISFTRFLSCKCVHLTGFICSDSCQLNLCNYLIDIFSNADIFTTTVPQIVPPEPNTGQTLTSKSIRRRIKKILSWWSGCVPRYHKKSYTVNAS